ncbi:MAG: segregation and condensation protein B [Gemmatimonadales bacterium]|nr:Segregation and condensation protein B [bacterium HR33]GIW51180.1 MAG: segregation and condensation protein B [Gemmatimonadales bacterium]
MQPLARLVEAALFAADRPLKLDELEQVAPDAGRESLLAAVQELRDHYQADEHGVELVELAEGFQILTRPEYAEALAQARIVNRPRKLSVAALETLAVIAYRQPVGRAEIEEIRGVAVDGVLRLLLERGLIEVVGRGEGIGRPLLYGTTPAFLELLGLSSLDELPKMEELSVVLRPLAEEAGE